MNTPDLYCFGCRALMQRREIPELDRLEMEAAAQAAIVGFYWVCPDQHDRHKMHLAHPMFTLVVAVARELLTSLRGQKLAEEFYLRDLAQFIGANPPGKRPLLTCEVN